MLKDFHCIVEEFTDVVAFTIDVTDAVAEIFAQVVADIVVEDVTEIFAEAVADIVAEVAAFDVVSTDTHAAIHAVALVSAH